MSNHAEHTALAAELASRLAKAARGGPEAGAWPAQNP